MGWQLPLHPEVWLVFCCVCMHFLAATIRITHWLSSFYFHITEIAVFSVCNTYWNQWYSDWGFLNFVYFISCLFHKPSLHMQCVLVSQPLVPFSLYGLRVGNAPWFMCWLRCYINCLFVCLLNFLLYFLLSLCFLSYLFTSLLVYFLT